MENIKSTSAISPPSICPITKHVFVSHKMKKLQGKGQTGGQIHNYTFGTGYIEEPWPIKHFSPWVLVNIPILKHLEISGYCKIQEIIARKLT